MKNLSRKEREKLTRKNEIIEAAKKLFCINGFDNTSMDDIAKEAEFTKRTVYQYFKGKNDLCFAIAFEGFKKMFETATEASKKGKTGFEKVYLSCFGYYKFYLENPCLFKLINKIGYFKTNNSPQRDEWLEYDNNMFKRFEQIIKLGQDDGSIKKNINPQMTAYSIAFMSTGFFHQLLETGKTFISHFNLSEEKFVEYSLNLFLDSIKAK